MLSGRGKRPGDEVARVRVKVAMGIKEGLSLGAKLGGEWALSVMVPASQQSARQEYGTTPIKYIPGILKTLKGGCP